MLEIFCGAWWPYLLAFLIGLATAYWAWSRSSNTNVAEPLLRAEPEPVAKISVADVAPVAAAVAAVPLMAAAAKPKATPKPKAAPVKKVVVKTTAPKPVVKPPVVKAVAAPKAAAPKAKVALVATPKVAAPKAKAPTAKLVAVAEPKAAAKPKAVAKPRIPDNLELLKGVGPKLNALLKTLGITTFDQVANWTAPDIADVDSKLGNFAGRIGRDNWVDQAKLLVKGDVVAFEKKYGSLGSEINRS